MGKPGPLYKANNTSQPALLGSPQTVSSSSAFGRYGVPLHYYLVSQTLALNTPFHITMGPSMLTFSFHKYKISHISDKAILFAMVIACLHSNFLFYEKIEGIFSSYNWMQTKWETYTYILWFLFCPLLPQLVLKHRWWIETQIWGC